ncbi:uncharacterized protein LOC111016689 [Momordica charantia]|uniref:Uncharacterized protein LOC111016689 n=1 Tax=Momordica charantia TaxID=3673 RepID=A0A6J1D3H5_MOMCH|nr:uncharacterized protein LOC111016689 [Momordica charantia]
MGEVKKSEERKCWQKCKVRWLIEGDENTKLFHGVLNSRRKRQRSNRDPWFNRGILWVTLTLSLGEVKIQLKNTEHLLRSKSNSRTLIKYYGDLQVTFLVYGRGYISRSLFNYFPCLWGRIHIKYFNKWRGCFPYLWVKSKSKSYHLSASGDSDSFSFVLWSLSLSMSEDAYQILQQVEMPPSLSTSEIKNQKSKIKITYQILQVKVTFLTYGFFVGHFPCSRVRSKSKIKTNLSSTTSEGLRLIFLCLAVFVICHFPFYGSLSLSMGEVKVQFIITCQELESRSLFMSEDIYQDHLSSHLSCLQVRSKIKNQDHLSSTTTSEGHFPYL